MQKMQKFHKINITLIILWGCQLGLLSGIQNGFQLFNY
jgi:hypothetical protein